MEKQRCKRLKSLRSVCSFSFVGTIAYLLIDNLRGPVSRNHATGLSAVVIALKDATVFNPFYWLGILLAFGLAFWLTTKFRAT